MPPSPEPTETRLGVEGMADRVAARLPLPPGLWPGELASVGAELKLLADARLGDLVVRVLWAASQIHDKP